MLKCKYFTILITIGLTLSACDLLGENDNYSKPTVPILSYLNTSNDFIVELNFFDGRSIDEIGEEYAVVMVHINPESDINLEKGDDIYVELSAYEETIGREGPVEYRITLKGEEISNIMKGIKKDGSKEILVSIDDKNSEIFEEVYLERIPVIVPSP